MLVALGAGAAFAQDAIATRKAQMKELGAAAGPLAKMLRGEDGFDLARVKTSLETFVRVAKAQGALYPDNSKDGDTKAQPAIWENRAKFNNLLAKFEAESGAALAAIRDEASFKAEIGKVLGNCGGCHTDFRAK
ncbi:MAG: cytochrome c [Hyphomicrobiales bacterium]|nr:cytochrome c [Hyphomicrobiales bacterium]